MKSYCSFLIIDPKHADLVSSLCSDAGWYVSFIPDPSERFWFHDSSVAEISHPSALGRHPPDAEPGLLFVVDGDETEADNIIGLIGACYDVIEGNPSQQVGQRSGFELPAKPFGQNDDFRNLFKTHGFFKRFTHKHELPVAVALATKAWKDKSLIYAIHKLSQSFETESITWWSTHPGYGQVFERHSELFSDHVRTSAAINLAFSAIEELKLQIISNAKNTRWLDGDWNPAVLANVERRLLKAGVDLEQKMAWIVRGDRTESEQSIKPVLGVPAPYGDDQLVRDLELTIPEALHNYSYIRNYMTAHGFSEASKFLGPYEVFNVQSLARRLILSKGGLWKVSLQDLVDASLAHR